MTPAQLTERCCDILNALGRAIVGKSAALRLLLAAILADGHVLIEDVPGVAKTSIARAASQVLGLPFKRLQFTPDLLPADLTGSFIFDQRSLAFESRYGPIFTQLLLADEINRAAPKTQSALLEAMQENQVTVEGETFPLARPFLVIATQNPIELDGTFALPEAQLDRFLIRLDLGYPTAEQLPGCAVARTGAASARTCARSDQGVSSGA
jgi:MoxR-like ATPase